MDVDPVTRSYTGMFDAEVWAEWQSKWAEEDAAAASSDQRTDSEREADEQAAAGRAKPRKTTAAKE